MLTVLALLGANFIVIEVFMLLLWLAYLLRPNIGLVDLGWGVSLVLASLVPLIGGDGYFWRRLLVVIVFAVWGIRLSYHLMRRFRFDVEDARWSHLMESPLYFGPLPFRVLVLYLLQGAVATLLSLPIAIMGVNQEPSFSTFEVFGLLIWMGGLAGEAIADGQLYAFKADSANEGKVCQEGLWRYSRHPNYFFEWIIWIGFALMAISSPFGWLGIIAPLIVLYLLVRVTGIPPLEQHEVEEKGEAYKQYQARISSFLPWFPS